MTRYVVSRACEGYQAPEPEPTAEALDLPDDAATECVLCGAPCAGVVCCSSSSYARAGRVVHDHPTCRACCCGGPELGREEELALNRRWLEGTVRPTHEARGLKVGRLHVPKVGDPLWDTHPVIRAHEARMDTDAMHPWALDGAGEPE